MSLYFSDLQECCYFSTTRKGRYILNEKHDNRESKKNINHNDRHCCSKIKGMTHFCRKYPQENYSKTSCIKFIRKTIISHTCMNMQRYEKQFFY